MRDDEFGGQVEAAHQFDGVFDAFALNDPRGLQEKVFTRLNAKVSAHSFGVGIRGGRRGVEIHYVGYHTRSHPITIRDLLGLDRVDDHMAYRRQGGRECRGKIIAHAVDLKTLALPMKVMMMRDGGEARLSDELRDGKSQRQVERDSHRIDRKS